MDINIVPLNGGHLDGMEELERQCFPEQKRCPERQCPAESEKTSESN